MCVWGNIKLCTVQLCWIIFVWMNYKYFCWLKVCAMCRQILIYNVLVTIVTKLKDCNMSPQLFSLHHPTALRDIRYTKWIKKQIFGIFFSFLSHWGRCCCLLQAFHSYILHYQIYFDYLNVINKIDFKQYLKQAFIRVRKIWNSCLNIEFIRAVVK